MGNLTVDEGLVIKLTADQLSQSPLKNSARGFTILTMPAAFRRTVDKPLDILAGDDSRGMKIFWDRIFNRNRNDLVYYAVDVRTRKYEFTLQPASAGRRYTTSARFRMQYEVHDPSKVALDKEDALRGVVDAVEKYIASIIADQTRINMWLLSSMDMILSNKLAELVTLYDEWGIVIKDLTLLEWALPDSYTSDYESHLKRVQEDKERQEEIARRRESQDRERKKREDETKHTIEMQRIEDDTAKQLHELERLKLDWQRKDDFEREQIEAQYKLQMEEVQANLVELQKRNSTRQSRLQAALAKDTAWLEDRQDELRTQNLLAANTRRDDVESAELERRRRHALDEEYHISDVEIIRIERISKKLELMGITETNFPSIRPMLMANPDKTYEIFNILFTQGLEQSKYLLDKFISTNETLILQGDKDTGDYNDLLKNLLLHNVTPQTAGLLGGVNPATETPKLTDQTPIQHDTADNSDYDDLNARFQQADAAVVTSSNQHDTSEPADTVVKPDSDEPTAFDTIHQVPVVTTQFVTSETIEEVAEVLEEHQMVDSIQEEISEGMTENDPYWGDDGQSE